MKIQKVTLKDFEVIEVNGEYQGGYKNEKTYPAFLTNYALKQGKEQGLIESSLFSDLLKLQGLQKLSRLQDDEDMDIDPNVFNNVDETKMTQIIYLSFKGANPTNPLSLDDFLKKYHYSLEQTMELYMELIMGLMEQDKNAFAAGLKKSTNKNKNNGKKYGRHHSKSNA